MFRSKCIPLWVRLLVPLVLVGNVGLFLSGHLSVGGTVRIDILLAGQRVVIDNFFEFSIAKSTVDLWNAGGRELAILILIFSGIWPYSKQIITLVLWFSPPSRVSVSTRGSTFLWLDTLAKWSSVDIFILIIALVAFRLGAVSPDLAFLPPNFYSIEGYVVPLWGLYANLTAQLLTQISSHWIIHYHRQVVETAIRQQDRPNERDTPESDQQPDQSENENVQGDAESNGSDGEHLSTASDDEADEPEALYKHGFGRPHRGEAKPLVVRSWVHVLILVGIFLVLCTVVSGCILPAFSMELLGLLGVVVEFGQAFEPATINQGIFSIVQLLVDQGRDLGGANNTVGLVLIASILILTVLVVPVVQAGALLVSWTVPMTKRFRRRLEVAIEILQSWQYVEVFVIAVIVSRIQLGQVSEFLINQYCDSLDETFATLVFFDILRPEDAQCFKVVARLESGTYVLIGTAFILAFVNTFVTRAVLQYQRESTEAAAIALIEGEVEMEEEGAIIEETQRMAEELDLDETIDKIEPTPVLFTDTFRWLLRNETGFTIQLSTIPEQIEESVMNEKD